jgi:hypothetical protein
MTLAASVWKREVPRELGLVNGGTLRRKAYQDARSGSQTRGNGVEVAKLAINMGAGHAILCKGWSGMALLLRSVLGPVHQLDTSVVLDYPARKAVSFKNRALGGCRFTHDIPSSFSSMVSGRCRNQ